MKKLITLLVTVSATFGLTAQDQISSDLVEITKQGLTENFEVSYHASPEALQVDHYLIPIAADTHVKFRKAKGSYPVWFALQNGTAITSIHDVNLRRASFELNFKSKQAAKDFIRQFEELANHN